MPQAFVKEAPRTLEGWRALWRFTEDPYVRKRRRTREVRVGDVGIGAENPIRIQSMTIADTMDTNTIVDEIEALAGAGSEIVRVTTPNRSAAQNLREIRRSLRRRGVRVPLVADVHFTPNAALIAAEHAEKVRINPGNYADRKHFKVWEYTDDEYSRELERLETAFKPLVLRCKELGVAMRIGTNHGSLSDRILNRYGDTPAGMVESALEFVRICETYGYYDIVLSMKASDVKVMIEAYRLLARRQLELDMHYPLHLGVTEAGSGLAARVKSSIGIATLLDDGLGDTVRVSLTEDSVHELPVARALADQVEHTNTLAGTQAANQAGLAGTPAHVRAPDSVPRWDPCYFERRRARNLGRGRARLAHDQPPRIEMVVGTGTRAMVSALQTLQSHESASEVDLFLFTLASDVRPQDIEQLARALESRHAEEAPGLGLELQLEQLADASVRNALKRFEWQRVSVRFDLDAAARLIEPDAKFAQRLRDLDAPLQFTLRTATLPDPEDVRTFAHAIADGVLPAGALALEIGDPFDAAHAWRALLAAWPQRAPDLPVVLRGPSGNRANRDVDRFASVAMLRTATMLGSLLADGVGEAVQLMHAPGRDAALLAREILQATRMRLSQADFIACPSCGRTQFDLQSTTALIQDSLRHLKGLKIAIMGCIVNGPGEMADADFGYVGSGPGRIDLYVGHERVERNVPQEEALERLMALIRRHGRWSEPDPA